MREPWLRTVNVPPEILSGIPAHSVARLRRQGERYYADGLRDLPDDRRLAILAVCAIEWRAALADAVIESHDRSRQCLSDHWRSIGSIGKTWKVAERRADAVAADHRTSLAETLKGFADVGTAMLSAHGSSRSVGAAVDRSVGWDAFTRLVGGAGTLTGNRGAQRLTRKTGARRA